MVRTVVYYKVYIGIPVSLGNYHRPRRFYFGMLSPLLR